MDKNIGPLTESDVIPILPVKIRKKVLATVATRIVIGARVSAFRKRDDTVVIEDVYGSTKMNVIDFNIAKEVAEKIVKELGLQRMVPTHQILVIRNRAQDIMESYEDEREGKRGIVMLRDSGGCGYWRMSLPSRYLDMESIYVDVTGGAVDFDHLLEYDIIFVQRVHNWDSMAVLERLKAGGKRIVYDLDDDIFNVPKSNPAHGSFGYNEQTAAVECMKLADVVTVSTKVLQERLKVILGGKVPVVVPNAIDPYEGWVPTEKIGSPDGLKRIFWQGSNTHDEDWNECFEAVQHVMKTRDDVRLVILGFMPSKVREGLETEGCWKNRVEFQDPMAPEAYFRMIKHIRADVGLAPLTMNYFNDGKSNIKWMENTMIGMPTVASNVGPYAATITHGINGFLCRSKDDWFGSISRCLDNAEDSRKIVHWARKKVIDEFNIKTVAQQWRKVLLGGSEGSSDSNV
jgi:glycosyltransferase involved in cell wall biosynthesis